MKKVKTIRDERYREFISELSKERTRLNISQAELAEKTDLNQSDISKIEKFEKRLDVLELTKILTVLRVSTNPRLQRLVLDFLGISE